MNIMYKGARNLSHKNNNLLKLFAKMNFLFFFEIYIFFKVAHSNCSMCTTLQKFGAGKIFLSLFSLHLFDQNTLKQ